MYLEGSHYVQPTSKKSVMLPSPQGQNSYIYYLEFFCKIFSSFPLTYLFNNLFIYMDILLYLHYNPIKLFIVVKIFLALAIGVLFLELPLIFWHSKMFQTQLVYFLPQLQNLLFFQAALVPFIEKWYEKQIWELVVLMSPGSHQL